MLASFFFVPSLARLLSLTAILLGLGMSIFLVFPFTRLVHVWSGFGTLVYLLRPYQLVRSRRLGLPASSARRDAKPGH